MRRRDWIIRAALAILTLAIYAQTLGFSLISYDDPEYVSSNPRVLEGLSWPNVVWAFRAGEVSNWHPLTWLSHMLDAELFGQRAGAHHAVSALLHLLNAILLFDLLRRLTGFAWRSALVAALFAAHPLHVESVAWVAERKDVLSTLFFLLTLLSYAGYATRGGAWRYLRTIALMACGLMAKPMLVTLPLVMLLLDYWPLGRLGDFSTVRRRVVEKIPMFALALASGVVTFLVQRAGGSVATLDRVGLWTRIGNAVLSCVHYLADMVWPAGLAPFYPYPDQIRAAQVIGAAALLLGVSLLVAWQAKRRPWAVVGWGWYLVTLLPVIGIVQVGLQARADRYTYIPLTGVFIVLVWLGAEVADRLRMGTVLRIAAAGVVLLPLTIAAWVQTRYWRNSHTLFAHAIEVTENNWLAYNHLATALAARGKLEEALSAAQRSVEIRPTYAIGHFNLANTFWKANRPAEALREYDEATRLKSDFAQAWNNAGVLLVELGEYDQAEQRFRRALAADPNYTDARDNLRRLEDLRRRQRQAATTAPGAKAPGRE